MEVKAESKERKKQKSDTPTQGSLSAKGIKLAFRRKSVEKPEQAESPKENKRKSFIDKLRPKKPSSPSKSASSESLNELKVSNEAEQVKSPVNAVSTTVPEPKNEESKVQSIASPLEPTNEANVKNTSKERLPDQNEQKTVISGMGALRRGSKSISRVSVAAIAEEPKNGVEAITEAYERKLRSMEQKLQMLEGKYEQKDAENVELLTKLNAMSSQSNKLQDRLQMQADFQYENDLLRSKLQEFENVREQLVESLNAARQNLIEAQANDSGQDDGDIQILHETISSLENAKEALNSRIEEMTSQINSLQQELDNSKAESAEIKELIKYKQKCEKLETELKELKNSHFSQELVLKSPTSIKSRFEEFPLRVNGSTVVDIIRQKAHLEWKLKIQMNIHNLYRKDTDAKLLSLESIIYALERDLERLLQVNAHLTNDHIAGLKKMRSLLTGGKDTQNLAAYTATVENRLEIALAELATLKQSESKLLKERKGGIPALEQKISELEEIRYGNTLSIQSLEEELFCCKSNYGKEIDLLEQKILGKQLGYGSDVFTSNAFDLSQASIAHLNKPTPPPKERAILSVEDLCDVKEILIGNKNQLPEVFDKVIAKLDAIVEDAQKSTASSSVEVNNLRKLLDEKERTLIRTNMAFRAYVISVNEFTSRNNMASIDLPGSPVDIQIDNSQLEFSKLQQHFDHSIQKLKDLHLKEIELLKKQLAASLATANEAQEVLSSQIKVQINELAGAEKEALLQRLEKKKSDIELLKQRMIKMNEEHNKATNGLKVESDQAKRDIENLQSQLEKSQLELKSARKLHNEQLVEMDAKLADITANLETKTAETESLKVALEDISNFKSSVDNAQEKALRELVSNLKLDLAEKNTKCDKLQTSIDHLKQESAKDRKEAEEKLFNLEEDFQIRFEQTKTELGEKHKIEVEHLQKFIEEQSAKINEAHEAEKALKKEIHSLKSEIVLFEGKLKSAQSEYKEQTDNNQKTIKELQQALIVRTNDRMIEEAKSHNYQNYNDLDTSIKEDVLYGIIKYPTDIQYLMTKSKFY